MFPVLIRIISATFLLYSGTLRHDFVNWDDDVYVYQNPGIQSVTIQNVVWFFAHSHYRAWIPLTMLSHAIDYSTWGLNPAGHHLTNVLLHAFNAAWIFLLGLALIKLSKQSLPDAGQRSLGVVAGRLVERIELRTGMAHRVRRR